MTTKHTPGPWLPMGSTVNEWVYYDIKNSNGVEICSLRFADGFHEANARLIAAAPDLLEACKAFCRKVEAGEAKSTRSYAQMKAAIAKAEGKE